MPVSRQPTDAGSGQGMALADTARDQRAVASLGQGGDATAFAVVPVALKYLVAENEHAPPGGPPGNLFQILGCEHAARRVGGGVNHDQAGATELLHQRLE